VSDIENSEYQKLIEPLEALGEALGRLLRDILAENHLRPHSISYRVKKEDDARRKLARRDKGRILVSLTDMLGLRIITYFRDEVDTVARMIEGEFAIDAENSVDKRKALDPDRFGYLSLHYVAQLASSRVQLVEYRKYAGIKFEIQIRSILQHAWAEIEHDLGYKAPAAVPSSVRRRFSRLAGLLEVADDEFVGIRAELAAHKTAATTSISEGRQNIELDQDSVYSYVRRSMQVKVLDQYAASLAGTFLGDIDPFYIGKRTAELAQSGVASIAELDTFVVEQRNLLRSFINRWVNEMTSAQNREPRFSCGATLFFVSLLLAGGALARGESTPYATMLSPENRDLLNRSFMAATKALNLDPKAVMTHRAAG
jgi:putative GTP pyrophosphokinase